jgi:protein gp37
LSFNFLFKSLLSKFYCNKNAKTKFLSCEPLIGPLRNINLEGIDWVIVGGESGRKARPMLESWVWDIKLQCDEQGSAFFFKQWGGVNKKKTGRVLGGSTYDAKPILTL